LRQTLIETDKEKTMTSQHRRLAAFSAVVTAMMLFAAACSSSGNKSSTGSGGTAGAGGSARTVTIGVVEDLSGAASVYGIPEMNGAQLAVQEINAAGGIKSLGGAKLALQKFDTASDPNQGVTQAQAAATAHVAAVVGGEISDTVLAGVAVTQRAGIPWLVTGGTANKIHQLGYNTVFQNIFDSDQYESDVLALLKEANTQLGISTPTLAVPYSQSSYGDEAFQAFTAANSSNYNYKVACSFSYPLTTTDFSSIAARSASCGATDIVNLGYPTDGLSLTKLFATQFHPTAKVWAATGLDPTLAVSQLGANANGVLTTANLNPTDKGVTSYFTKEYNAYKTQFKATPVFQTWQGYSSIYFIAAALQKAGSTDGAKLTAALHQVSLTQGHGDVYATPSSLSFASNGTLNQAPFVFSQVQNQTPMPVYPSTYAEAKIQPYPF
jgi:branched-chain amino acid transport system substrate-binding protein